MIKSSPDKKTLKLMGRLLAMPHKPHAAKKIKKTSKKTSKRIPTSKPVL